MTKSTTNSNTVVNVGDLVQLTAFGWGVGNYVGEKDGAPQLYKDTFEVLGLTEQGEYQSALLDISPEYSGTQRCNVCALKVVERAEDRIPENPTAKEIAKAARLLQKVNSTYAETGKGMHISVLSSIGNKVKVRHKASELLLNEDFYPEDSLTSLESYVEDTLELESERTAKENKIQQQQIDELQATIEQAQKQIAEIQNKLK